MLESDLCEQKEHRELTINVHSYEANMHSYEANMHRYEVNVHNYEVNGYEAPKVESFKRENSQTGSKIARSLGEEGEGRVERPGKKKLKLIKVPERVEKVLEQLYSDSLELLDLTNAELGDATVLQICEFLRGSRVRVAKFIRNRLTDEALPRMLPALANLTTLYLSQNQLTEQALEHLLAASPALPNLRSLVLSQNRIIERKHKAAIERLRKLGIVVSV